MVELKAFLGNLLLFSVEIVEKLFQTKADLPLEGIFFALNFLPWEFLLIKKLEIEKTKTTFIISVLKVVYLVVLVFLIPCPIWLY